MNKELFEKLWNILVEVSDTQQEDLCISNGASSHLATELAKIAENPERAESVLDALDQK